jgi:NB-ARC domain
MFSAGSSGAGGAVMNSDFLNRLASAQTDDERSWLVTEMRLAGLEEDLRSIIWAAAIVHRFDAETLAALCPELGNLIPILYEEVRQLSFVEMLEDEQYKLHDLTRRLMLDQFWADNREEFQRLSLRAAQYFSARSEKVRDQIEAVYHWIEGDEAEGIRRLSRLVKNWRSNFQDSALQSLFQVLDELIHSQRASRAIVEAVSSAKEMTQSKTKGISVGRMEKPEVPFPRVQLPENFVERPKELAAIKARLLADDDRTLVVSAIAGLGGLGKSVLATATILDSEIQERFDDGILWTTLGQQPDLLSCLGDWIRALDKSRDAFSANTLESASEYLASLLVERRMLLVIDDVWKEDHAKYFCVGGPACRVLVTTRQVRLARATYLNLDVMLEGEAIELVRRKMGRAWKPEDESDIREFARELGYLPLGLDLAANHLRDGFSWRDLKLEFNAGRRVLLLEKFGSAEALLSLDDNEKRQYSLKACFELSLRLLKPSQVKQFAWLGVLPEDINLTPEVGMVLWNLPLVRARKVLIDFQSRSLLMDGVQTQEDEQTYRMHDLMHDMARNLIEQGVLQGVLGVGSLEESHQQFLQQYLERSESGSWYQLPQDGYIHKHLTWHLEQAGWIEQIHQLLEASDELGRNRWFEACEQIGEPAVFVKSVGDAWRWAEALYEREPERAIVLQVRYALMMGSLNSLLENLPVAVMAGLVKDGVWSLDRAWAYVEQMQNKEKIAGAIRALVDILTKPLFAIAVKKVRLLHDKSRALTFIVLAQKDAAYFTEALEAARSIQDESSRADVLSSLAKIDNVYFAEALEAARSIQDESSRADVLSSLAKIDNVYFTEALEAARSIQDESSRADVLSSLAKIDNVYFTEALEAARSIQNEYRRTSALSSLAEVDNADFTQLLEAARSIQDEHSRASVLSSLAKIDSAYFTEALEAARSIQDEYSRASVLSSLAKIDNVYFTEALDAIRSVQNEYIRTSALSSLAEVDNADFAQLLEAARSIQDEYIRADVLTILRTPF